VVILRYARYLPEVFGWVGDPDTVRDDFAGLLDGLVLSDVELPLLLSTLFGLTVVNQLAEAFVARLLDGDLFQERPEVLEIQLL